MITDSLQVAGLRLLGNNHHVMPVFRTGRMGPLVLCILAAPVLASCVQSTAHQLAPSVQTAPLTSGADDFSGRTIDTRLRAQDRISIIVLREPDLSLPDIRVGDDGMIDMPQIGRVRVDGRSTGEIAWEIRDRLAREYLRDPRVAVNVIAFASHLVTVEDAVGQPGIYQFQPGTTLLGAVALARGPTRTARLRQVAIFRTVNDERSVAVFDLAQVRAGQMVDPVIVAGDRVLIGFDGLSQAWQDFLRAAPLAAAFAQF
ncbi:MAG: polysaccharide biosynthesis/export family protein [Novosphingobium sp.]